MPFVGPPRIQPLLTAEELAADSRYENCELWDGIPVVKEPSGGYSPFVAVELLLAGVKRVLAPGGRFVSTTPNPACYSVLSHDFWRDPTHVRFYDLPLLEFLCRQAGLEVEETGTNPANHPGPPPEYLGPEPVVHPPVGDSPPGCPRSWPGRGSAPASMSSVPRRMSSRSRACAAWPDIRTSTQNCRRSGRSFIAMIPSTSPM